jgi:hypothetical protein
MTGTAIAQPANRDANTPPCPKMAGGAGKFARLGGEIEIRPTPRVGVRIRQATGEIMSAVDLVASQNRKPVAVTSAA